MIGLLAGGFLVLHGLVHLWYVTLAQQMVEFQSEMAWTADSWILGGVLGSDALRGLATAMYLLAAVAFVGSGVALALGTEWARGALAVAAVFSSVVVLIFWDGDTAMLVQKGLLALAINIGALVALGVTD